MTLAHDKQKMQASNTNTSKQNSIISYNNADLFGHICILFLKCIIVHLALFF